VQYAPTYHHDLSWQLYQEYQAKVTFKQAGWNTLGVEVFQNNLIVYVNDEQVLTLTSLKTDLTKGEIGLFALFGNRFSNFSVTEYAGNAQKLVSEKTALAPNTIQKWELSQAFLLEEQQPEQLDLTALTYHPIKTERSGLLPIAKHLIKPSAGSFEGNKEVFAIAKIDIESPTESTHRFTFDYSDKIQVYLNQQLVFTGNNAFRSKGKQYQGHIDPDTNTLFLNLKKGQNTIYCVVIDKANGWGLTGKLIPQ